MSPTAAETSESGRIGMKADEGLSEGSPALRVLAIFELNPPESTSGDICPRLVLRCPSVNTTRELIEESGPKEQSSFVMRLSSMVNACILFIVSKTVVDGVMEIFRNQKGAL